MKKTLIIFTRYPEPGRTKTRLIPALGPEGAADLQRQLTERLLKRVRAAQDALGKDLAVEVWFEGGDAKQMRAWLGTGLTYRPQSSGDIGERMARAFEAVFAEGAGQALLIGSDIPGITGDLLAEAFGVLEAHDCVLGPARDGGYYLIGLKCPAPDLFADVPWSTDAVLEETLAIADRLGLSVAQTQELSDLDTPESLAEWQSQTLSDTVAAPGLLSVIIPTLDEAENIARTLQAVRDRLAPSADADGTPSATRVEVIVVDGGSTDDTVGIARTAGAIVLESPPGRGGQMDCGAAHATGEMLLFLHADTLPPVGYDHAIRRTLVKSGVAAGAFELGIDAPGRRLRRLERLVNWRSRRLGMPYGDQGLFLRSDLFQKAGGFRALPLFEDVDLVRRLRRLGHIEIVRHPVQTSARRWLRKGVWRTTCLNQIVLAGYVIGVSPERLARIYYGKRRKK